AVSLRIKKPGGGAVAACARPAMHDDDRLAGGGAVFLPIDPMLGKSPRRPMAGSDERGIRWLGVRRGRLWDWIQGNYFCDKWKIGCERARALAAQLTPKSSALRSVVQLDAHPAFCRSLGKLQEPGAYSASGPHRERKRVKERSHECMAR